MSFDENNDPDKKLSPLIFFLFILLILGSILIVGMVWTLIDPDFKYIPEGFRQFFNSL
ncbi:hypothetical protein SAMN05421510_10804 [Nitrosomonas ureae]|uniref:Uncharacterized protein n=1 Tax=Nitrosomonas ureae TaxID=44577 RepID=A0A1H9GX82_9PROT|nr:hypothetical protein SAMN05421510_10804 [Nitrosomonas ureae]